MQIVFLSKFSKDLSKINQHKVLADIEKAIIQVENVKTTIEINQLKKLKDINPHLELKLQIIE